MLAIAGFFLAAVMVVLGILLARNREPEYQGRPLSYWSRQHGPVDYPDDSKLPPAAQQAIHSIGTNAIPFALEWISWEPSAFRLKLLQNLGPAVGEAFGEGGDEFAFQAENVFTVLGSDARPAIGELTRLAIASRTETRVWRCSRALVDIGPEGVSGLIGIIGATNCDWSWVAAMVIFKLGSNATPAIPILLQAANGGDDRLACAAMGTLGSVAALPSRVIPVLIDSLQCTNANRRIAAAAGLAEFGVAAKSAIPQLQQSLVDPNSMVREQATNAVLRIAPEVLNGRAE